MTAVERNGHGLQGEEPLDGRDRAREALLMGLRLAEGVDLDRIARLSGLPVDMLVDRDAVARIAGHGMIRQDGQRLRVDPAGMLLLDAILPEIVAV